MGYRLSRINFLRGAKGEDFPAGRKRARNPTASLVVTRGLLRSGDLGPTVGAVLMYAHHVRRRSPTPLQHQGH